MATICQQCCISERADDVLCLFVFVCEFVFACLGQNVTRAGPSSARPSQWSEGRATRCMSIVRLCVILCVVHCALCGHTRLGVTCGGGPICHIDLGRMVREGAGQNTIHRSGSDVRGKRLIACQVLFQRGACGSTRCGKSWPSETIGVSRPHWLLRLVILCVHRNAASKHR